MVILACGIFGLFWGSFLAASLVRLRLRDAKFWLGRSRCLSCQKQLALRDLIPVLSFLFLRGRCRFCQQKIPYQDFALEILTGFAFAVTAYLGYDFISTHLIWCLFLASVLIFLAAYDFLYYEIPDEVVLPSLGFIWIGSLLSFTPTPLASSLGILLGGSAFALLVLISQGRWLGGGDIRFAALLGGFLGPLGLLIAIFLASLSGVIIGGGLILTKRKKLSSPIPFGPLLALGGFLSLFFGTQIWNWYLLNFWVS